MGKKPDISPPKKVKLVDLPRTLASQGLSGISYNTIYSAAVNGTIPAERTFSGTRWVVDESAIPQIIESFSLLKESVHDKDSQK